MKNSQLKFLINGLIKIIFILFFIINSTFIINIIHSDTNEVFESNKKDLDDKATENTDSEEVKLIKKNISKLNNLSNEYSTNIEKSFYKKYKVKIFSFKKVKIINGVPVSNFFGLIQSNIVHYNNKSYNIDSYYKVYYNKDNLILKYEFFYRGVLKTYVNYFYKKRYNVFLVDYINYYCNGLLIAYEKIIYDKYSKFIKILGIERYDSLRNTKVILY